VPTAQVPPTVPWDALWRAVSTAPEGLPSASCRLLGTPIQKAWPCCFLAHRTSAVGQSPLTTGGKTTTHARLPRMLPHDCVQYEAVFHTARGCIFLALLWRTRDSARSSKFSSGVKTFLSATRAAFVSRMTGRNRRWESGPKKTQVQAPCHEADRARDARSHSRNKSRA
jgi:hypothetical protein